MIESLNKKAVETIARRRTEVRRIADAMEAFHGSQ
jgi:hypothetical protein